MKAKTGMAEVTPMAMPGLLSDREETGGAGDNEDFMMMQML